MKARHLRFVQHAPLLRHSAAQQLAGAGGNPLQGQLAAEESQMALKEITEGADMVRPLAMRQSFVIASVGVKA